MVALVEEAQLRVLDARGAHAHHLAVCDAPGHVDEHLLPFVEPLDVLRRLLLDDLLAAGGLLVEPCLRQLELLRVPVAELRVVDQHALRIGGQAFQNAGERVLPPRRDQVAQRADHVRDDVLAVKLLLRGLLAELQHPGKVAAHVAVLDVERLERPQQPLVAGLQAKLLRHLDHLLEVRGAVLALGAVIREHGHHNEPQRYHRVEARLLLLGVDQLLEAFPHDGAGVPELVQIVLPGQDAENELLTLVNEHQVLVVDLPADEPVERQDPVHLLFLEEKDRAQAVHIVAGQPRERDGASSGLVGEDLLVVVLQNRLQVPLLGYELLLRLQELLRFQARERHVVALVHVEDALRRRPFLRRRGGRAGLRGVHGRLVRAQVQQVGRDGAVAHVVGAEREGVERPVEDDQRGPRVPLLAARPLQAVADGRGDEPRELVGRPRLVADRRAARAAGPEHVRELGGGPGDVLLEERLALHLVHVAEAVRLQEVHEVRLPRHEAQADVDVARGAQHGGQVGALEQPLVQRPRREHEEPPVAVRVVEAVLPLAAPLLRPRLADLPQRPHGLPRPPAVAEVLGDPQHAVLARPDDVDAEQLVVRLPGHLQPLLQHQAAPRQLRHREELREDRQAVPVHDEDPVRVLLRQEPGYRVERPGEDVLPHDVQQRVADLGDERVDRVLRHRGLGHLRGMGGPGRRTPRRRPHSLQKMSLAGAQPQNTKQNWFQAVRNNDIDFVRQNYRFFAGQYSINGYTGLHLAAKFNHLEIAELLAPYEARMLSGKRLTALMIAAQHDHSDIVALLAPLESKLRVNNTTALIMASKRGFIRSAQILSLHEPQEIPVAFCAARAGRFCEVANYLQGYINGDLEQVASSRQPHSDDDLLRMLETAPAPQGDTRTLDTSQLDQVSIDLSNQLINQLKQIDDLQLQLRGQNEIAQTSNQIQAQLQLNLAQMQSQLQKTRYKLNHKASSLQAQLEQAAQLRKELGDKDTKIETLDLQLAREKLSYEKLYKQSSYKYQLYRDQIQKLKEGMSAKDDELRQIETARNQQSKQISELEQLCENYIQESVEHKEHAEALQRQVDQVLKENSQLQLQHQEQQELMEKCREQLEIQQKINEEQAGKTDQKDSIACAKSSVEQAFDKLYDEAPNSTLRNIVAQLRAKFMQEVAVNK